MDELDEISSINGNKRKNEPPKCNLPPRKQRATMNISLRALKQTSRLSHSAVANNIMRGAVYGAGAYLYGAENFADLELSSSQGLLLALLHSLVTEEVTSCCMLAEVCFQVRQLQSDHLRVWLIGDFLFPREDMEKATTLLGKLLSVGMLKIPQNVIRIMSSLAAKYGMNGFGIAPLSKERCADLATQLEIAVANNSHGDIITLASEGGDINGVTQFGDSLVHLAARADSFNAISALGCLGAKLDVVNSSYATPLEEAVKNNCVRSIKALLLAGAKIDKLMFRGDTYLHIGAARGQSEALKFLLEAGIEINKINYYGETALFCAVKMGNVLAVGILLENGANSKIIPVGSKNILDMIMEVENIDKLKEYSKFENIINLKSKDDDTILHLLAHSGDVEKFNIFKNSVIHLASMKNINGITPLHVASDISIVRMLINMGADIDSQDNDLRTPLMMASKNSKADIVRLLLFNGANPKCKDKSGRIALHYAAEGGCTDSVTVLLDMGENVNEKDSSGNTPYHVATINGKQGVAQLLVERGAQFQITCQKPTTHIIYEKKKKKMDVLLI